MIEIYRDRDYTKVALYRSILEVNGIRAEIGNRNAVTMTTEIPIPDMFPYIYVFSKEDAQKGRELLRGEHLPAESDKLPDWMCKHCGVTNEGSFGECWSCQKPVDSEQ